MNAPLFGLNIDPNTDQLQTAFERAAFADTNGIDLIAIQDHPYQRRFMDTWTLLGALAARTTRVHFTSNVANLPLRPPAMLAKQLATLDVLSNGRVELGLGAGAFWPAIAAFGGPTRTPAEAYQGFEDALHILRGLWESGGRGFTYEGPIYQVRGAQFGPAPLHRIPIWVGGYGPKMLRLTGRMADGLLVSSGYTSVDQLRDFNAKIDAGAMEAGRDPSAIRRGYNLMGIVDVGQFGGRLTNLQPGTLYGTPREWTDMLVNLAQEHGMDSFLLWPAADAVDDQLRAYVDEIIPGVRAALNVPTA